MNLCEFYKKSYLNTDIDKLIKELSSEIASADEEDRDEIIREFFTENKKLATLDSSALDDLVSVLGSDDYDEIFETYNKEKDNFLDELNKIDEILSEDMSLEDLEEELDEDEFTFGNANEIYDMVDLDGDNKLNSEELVKFREELAKMNGDDKTLANAIQGSSPGGSIGGASGANYIGNYNGVGGTDGTGDTSGTQGSGDTSNPETMSVEQLQAQKTTLEGEVSTLEGQVSDSESQITKDTEALSNARDAETKAKGLMDDENQKMLDAIENDENVTQEQKDQLSELELKISDNSTAITKKQEAITTLEGSIASAETEIAAFNTSISEKQGQISDLSGTISGLREQLNAVQGDDEAAVSQRQSFKSQIDTKNTELQALKTQLDEEIAAKQAKESEKADLESQLQTARDEKAQLDANETDLLNQKTELLDQFKENATPETKAIIDNYETLKKAYEDSKTEVKTCETNLDTSRAKLNEVNASLNTKNAELSEVTSVLATKENEKAQAVSDTGQVEIPDFVPDVDQKFIRQLHPEMQAKVVEFYKAAKDAGLEFAINYEGQVRTLGQQEELKRSNARRYGTPNPFGTSSMHLMGLAIDISPIKGSYAQLGAIGKSVGLTWGGDFKSNGSIEQHHFQFDAPIIALQSQYGKGTVECNRMIALNYPCFKAFGSNKRYELNSVYSVEELRGKGYKC